MKAGATTVTAVGLLAVLGGVMGTLVSIYLWAVDVPGEPSSGSPLVDFMGNAWMLLGNLALLAAGVGVVLRAEWGRILMLIYAGLALGEYLLRLMADADLHTVPWFIHVMAMALWVALIWFFLRTRTREHFIDPRDLPLTAPTARPAPAPLTDPERAATLRRRGVRAGGILLVTCGILVAELVLWTYERAAGRALLAHESRVDWSLTAGLGDALATAPAFFIATSFGLAVVIAAAMASAVVALLYRAVPRWQSRSISQGVLTTFLVFGALYAFMTWARLYAINAPFR